MNHKYKSSEVKVRPWQEIEHFYNDLISHDWPLQDIIPVIQYIRNDNSLRQKLFAFTSLDKLVISIYDPIELNREALHIHYEKERNFGISNTIHLLLTKQSMKEIIQENY